MFPGSFSRCRLNGASINGLETARGISNSNGALGASVADVATLRSGPALTGALSIRLDCHTYPGHGGGDLYWDSLSTETDDNGTCFAVTGRATGRWKRRSKESRVRLVDFGGDPTGVNASDAAFTAAYAFIRTGVEQKSVDLEDGHFKFAAALSIYTSNVVIRGNHRSTVLEFTGGTNGFEITTQLMGFKLLGVHVTCNAVVSGNLFDLSSGQACLLGYDIDITLGGKWTAVVGGGGTNAEVRGAFQWGRMRLQQLSAVNAPANGIYLEGAYFNSCWTYIDFYGIAGDAIHIEGMADYVWGGWGEFEGSVQDCGRQLYLKDSSCYRFRNFYSENQPALDLIENCRWLDFKGYSTTGLDLRTTTQCDCRATGGMFREDANCWGNQTDDKLQGRPGIGHALERVNMSCINEGGAFVLELAGGGPGGFSHNDPENLLMGGDFSRWIAGVGNQVWGALAGRYNATRCGVGCIDATRTQFAPNCAKLSVDTDNPAVNWITCFEIIPAGALDDTFAGVPVFVSWKAKGWTGAMPGAAVSALTVVGEEHRSYGCGIPCEDGFTRFVLVRRLTTALVASGMQFNLTGAPDEICYVSEVTVSIGNGAPRTFTRASSNPWNAETAIDEYGRLIWYSTAAPVVVVDPILGRSVQDGDLVAIKDPAIEVTSGGQSFRTVSHSRIAGAWEANQLLTGLVGV